MTTEVTSVCENLPCLPPHWNRNVSIIREKLQKNKTFRFQSVLPIRRFVDRNCLRVKQLPKHLAWKHPSPLSEIFQWPVVITSLTAVRPKTIRHHFCSLAQHHLQLNDFFSQAIPRVLARVRRVKLIRIYSNSRCILKL